MDNLQQKVAFAVAGAVTSAVLTSVVVPYFFPNVTIIKQAKDELKTRKVRIPITYGMCNFSGTSVEINTSHPARNGYVYFPDSNNLKGGSQFSYTFWLKLTSSKLNNSGKIIFMRGIYSSKYDTSVSKGRVENHPNDSEILVKCPLVRFSKQATNQFRPCLDIEFNTLKNPHNVVKLDQSVFDLLQSTVDNSKWYLVSLVFQDYIDFTNSEKGVQVQVFLNDTLVRTEIIKQDSIKVNHGDVILTPTKDATDSESFYSSLTYYNYALDIIEIQNIFLARASTDACTTAKEKSVVDLNLQTKQEYNSLSLFNQLRQK